MQRIQNNEWHFSKARVIAKRLHCKNRQKNFRKLNMLIEVSDAFFNNEPLARRSQYSEYDEFIQCTMHLRCNE